MSDRSDVIDPTDPTSPDDRSSFEAWKANRDERATALAAEANGEPACPTCNATDSNPSFEVLPHCWRCGHTSDTWPPADTAGRREAAGRRRIGLV